MSFLNQFGIPAAGYGNLQPKLQNHWQMTFVGLSKLVSSVNSRDITKQLTRTDRPSIQFRETEVHRYNTTSYVQGKYNWDPLNFALEDDINGLAARAIQGQLETQQRITGSDLPGQWINTAATGSDYKFGAILEMLDGNETVIERWRMEGCWFTSVKPGSLDYASSDAVVIDITMRFDHARQELLGGGYGTALGGNL